ncbi:tyrosine protein phosphatase [Colwellia sp. KU-HH00111]|uniref:tyrosine-protein phosphatase n=1 Tax=Colwellia sp. KU-HH00111 TaxID=3127652 RepID=UPI0031040205
MIDLHCHVLPGIDDGAKTMDESLSLIQAAIDDGITRIICTPHIQPGIYDNTLASITDVFSQLKEQVTHHSLNIELAFAAEVRLCPEIMVLAKQNKLPFIGLWQEQQVLLLELPHSHVPAGTEQLINWLKKNGIIAMIAHPERNRDILADFSKFKQLARTGCLFQITAASVCGDFGEKIQQLSYKLLLDDLVSIIATDAHSIKRRPPKLSQAKAKVAELVGLEKAHQLVYEIPKLISESKFSAFT